MPTPTHEFPIQDMEPPDEIENDLECPECGREMEPAAEGEWECEWPFCDSNNLDPEKEYESRGDYLYMARRDRNKAFRFMRGMLKCIEREQIHGSAAFNSMVADARILIKLDEKNGGR